MNRFATVADLLSYLSDYKTYYYRWIALDALLTTTKSPTFSDEPHGSSQPLESRILQQIEDKEELEKAMSEIKSDIIRLKDVSYKSYTIMIEKFVYFKTLEEISLMMHYSLDHMKHDLYPKAQLDLFRILNEERENDSRTD